MTVRARTLLVLTLLGFALLLVALVAAIAKADLVPTEHNLRLAYEDFEQLERACEVFCERVNAREHRVTRGGKARRVRSLAARDEADARARRRPRIPHRPELREIPTAPDIRA